MQKLVKSTTSPDRPKRKNTIHHKTFAFFFDKVIVEIFCVGALAVSAPVASKIQPNQTCCRGDLGCRD